MCKPPHSAHHGADGCLRGLDQHQHRLTDPRSDLLAHFFHSVVIQNFERRGQMVGSARVRAQVRHETN